MSIRTSATRYAKALFDVAVRESDPAAIERDLASIVDAMRSNEELRRAMLDPGIPQTARVNVVRAIAEQAAAAPPLAKLLVLLAERRRLELLPVLLEVYRDRVLAHANIVRARVDSASPLSEDQVRALQQNLSGATGKTVDLQVGVDPSLIGGLVATIGSTVYDGSIRTQLARIKQRLVETA